MNDGIPKFKLPFAAADHDDVAEILAAIAALGARVDAKFSEIEARLAAADSRAEEINQRLAPILATIKANLDHIRRGGP